MMPTPPRRRWFRFGLGTLFLAVAVVAALLAYHLNWIQQRHQLIVDEDQSAMHEDPPEVPLRAPALLWLFGEKGFDVVEVVVEGPTLMELTEADMRKGENSRRLFPEAAIRARHFQEPNGKIKISWYAPFPWTPEMRKVKVTNQMEQEYDLDAP